MKFIAGLVAGLGIGYLLYGANDPVELRPTLMERSSPIQPSMTVESYQSTGPSEEDCYEPAAVSEKLNANEWTVTKVERLGSTMKVSVFRYTKAADAKENDPFGIERLCVYVPARPSKPWHVRMVGNMFVGAE